jgi:hypothetical protein
MHKDMDTPLKRLWSLPAMVLFQAYAGYYPLSSALV